MKLAALALSLAVLLALSACDTTETRPPPPYDLETLRFDASLIVGTWDLRWEGSYWGGTQGPASPPERTLVIRGDSTYTYLVGGEVEREGTYEVGQACPGTPQENGCRDTLRIAWYSWYAEWHWQGVSEEWLVFDSRGQDGLLWAFRRR